MVDFLSPGTKTIQRRKGPVVLPSIATAIGGFHVFCEKGPTDKPILVTGPDDAEEVFGSRITNPGNGRLVDSLSDFFNQGGSSCYVMRYIGSGAAASTSNVSSTGGATSGQLKSNAGTFPAALSPGDTFAGSVDGTAQGTVTIAATPATSTGVGGTFASVAASTTAVFTIAGIPGNQTVTFDGTENSAATFAAQLNAQLRGAQVAVVGGQVKITTDMRGSGAAGTIVSLGTGLAASLGMTTGAFTNAGPNNVATVDAVTAAEIKALFDATFTGTGGKSSVTTVNSDGSVTWASTATGATSSVQFTSGTGVAKIAGFDTAAHPGTNLSPLPTAVYTMSSVGTWGDVVSRQHTKVDVPVTKVNATSAGSTTQLRVASTARLAKGDTISITKSSTVYRGIIKLINGTLITLVSAIVVPGGGFDGSEDVVLETFNLTLYDANGLVLGSPWKNLRMSPLAGLNYFVNAIGSTPRSPIVAEDLEAAAADPRPATDSSPVLFSGGADGAAPTASDVINQVDFWDKAQDVSFISMPAAATDFTGDDGVAILKKYEAYGERRADVMIIVDLPKGTPPTGTGGVKDWIQNEANLASSYEACYWPWANRLDEVSGIVQPFPLSPFIQGIIARTHYNKNFGKAPAGIIDGQLLGINGLEYEIGEGSEEYNDFYPANVNAALKFPGQGFAVFGSRTMDPTGEFGQINVQVVFNVNKRLARQKTRFVNFETNNTDTRASVTRVLTATFREQRTAGILAGSKDDEAFYIICDESNNTPLVRKKGKLACRVGLAVENPAEFLEFTFEQDTRAVDQALAALGT